MLLYSKLSEKNKCNSIYNLDYWQDVKKPKKEIFCLQYIQKAFICGKRK